MKKLTDAGITPVIVPASDKDHQGTVYDKDEDDGQSDLFGKGETAWSETEA